MGVEKMVLDTIDHEIIGVIRNEGRISWRDLGERIGLGSSSTAERVRRLEAVGVITGYCALIDSDAVGRGLQAVIDMRLGSGASVDEFESALATTPSVLAAEHLTGPFDYQIRVACTGVSELDHIVRSWKARFGGETSTRIVLHVVDLAARRLAERP